MGWRKRILGSLIPLPLLLWDGPGIYNGSKREKGGNADVGDPLSTAAHCTPSPLYLLNIS